MIMSENELDLTREDGFALDDDQRTHGAVGIGACGVPGADLSPRRLRLGIRYDHGLSRYAAFPGVVGGGWFVNDADRPTVCWRDSRLGVPRERHFQILDPGKQGALVVGAILAPAGLKRHHQEHAKIDAADEPGGDPRHN